MNRDMEKNLSACLDNLEKGDSVDAILAGYPEEAAELRPYLETAAQMSQLASLPTIADQQQSQATFLAEAAALRSPQSSPMPIWFTLRRLMMPLASLAVILFLLGFTLVTMSAAALPGDGLYSVKLGIEEFRLMRASDPEQILILAEQFQQERLREVEVLLRAGRTADVLFEGEIEAIDLATWIIAGLPVQIDSGTIIDGTPQVGELARVDGRTVDGQLFAGHIIILTGTPGPEEIPLPALIPPLEPTETPQPSPTPTPTATQTPPISLTPSATAEIRLTPTDASGDSSLSTPPATVVDPPATATPANDNDAANGNEDDSSGGDSDDNDDAGEEEDGSDDGSNDNDAGEENDNDGDDDNDNEDDEENSNEEDDDIDGDGDNNDNEEENDNDEEDSGDNENDAGNEEDVDNSGDDDNE
jgi:hypothetical protein